MDDLDALRCNPADADHILNTLERFGLHWDESVVYQSNRHALYEDAIESLQRSGRLYACDCSRLQIACRSASHSAQRYDGHCRDRRLPPAQNALRVRTDTTPIVVNDLIQGPYSQSLADEIGDFVVFRRDGQFAYHLATVVDDAAQGITEILRGYDLLDSTPRQILLQRLLGHAHPVYAHIPVLTNALGQKLSKQTFALDVATLPVLETLHFILETLQFKLPPGLKGEPVSSLLEWAVPNWHLNQIPRSTKIETGDRNPLQCQ